MCNARTHAKFLRKIMSSKDLKLIEFYNNKSKSPDKHEVIVQFTGTSFKIKLH